MIRNLVRPVNLISSGYSYFKSTVTRKPEIKGLPPFINMELTNNCNLHCSQCFSGSGLMTRKKGFMEIDLFNRVMKELGHCLYHINLYFQGEPMLHPLFFNFLENCHTPFSVVSTNGHFLTEENSEKLVRSSLRKIIVSMDGIDQTTYSSYRKDGDVDRVINGLRNLSKEKIKARSKLNVELQVLVNCFNENQIKALKGFSKSIHASLKLKSMQIIDENKELWLPSDKRFRRYRLKSGEYEIKSSLPGRCSILWFNPVITWDGKVIPCCFDKDAEYVMGDLTNESFWDIWNGTKYRIFRKSILTGRHLIEMCRNCTSGLKGVRY